MCLLLGSTEFLNINSCYAEEFGCDNGICIPRFHRCDHKSQCLHGEDELGCEMIELPEGLLNIFILFKNIYKNVNTLLN